MNLILITIQIVVCILLVISILLQQRGTALGSAFGGGGEMYIKRRGFEKRLFWVTIILSALFLAISYIIVAL